MRGASVAITLFCLVGCGCLVEGRQVGRQVRVVLCLCGRKGKGGRGKEGRCQRKYMSSTYLCI